MQIIRIPESVSSISVGLTITNSSGGNVHLQGPGTLKALSSGMTMLELKGGNDLVIEDVTFDLNGFAYLAINGNGSLFNSLTIRRCRFINMTAPCHGLVGVYCSRIIIEDCLFDGSGFPVGIGMEFANTFQDIYINRCTFRGVYGGVIIAPLTFNPSSENVNIENCLFDMMWYSLPTLPGLTGSGSTVSYTSNTITDSSKNFTINRYGEAPGILTQYSYIRAMPIRATQIGTLRYERTVLRDSGAQFLSKGIIPGELVRAGSAFGIIRSVESDIQLNIEEWLDDATRVPIGVPVSSTYTVYGVILGKIGTNPGVDVGSTLTTYGVWSDLNGNVVTPDTLMTKKNGTTEGALYEMLPIPNYPITGGAIGPVTKVGVQKVRIVGNTFRRSYTDSISPFCNEVVVAHNIISDGQDIGITMTVPPSGGHWQVHDNSIYREGTHGIFLFGFSTDDQSTNVHDNLIVGWGCRMAGLSVFPSAVAGAIAGEAMSGGRVHGNMCDGSNFPLSEVGLALDGTNNVSIYDNTCINLTPSGAEILMMDQTDPSLPFTANLNNFIRHQPSTHPPHPPTPTVYYASGVGQLSELYGSVSPANTVTAAVGSTYRDTTNGHLWFKTSGTDNTGWTMVV
jgi:hypothetical protein